MAIDEIRKIANNRKRINDTPQGPFKGTTIETTAQQIKRIDVLERISPKPAKA